MSKRRERPPGEEAPNKRKNDRLNLREVKFCAEYLIDENGTQAAIRAGYSKNGAAQNASRMLTKPRIKAALERMARERLQRVNITAARIAEEMSIVAFSDPLGHYRVDDSGEVMLTTDAPPGAMRAINRVKYRIRTDPEGRSVREVEVGFVDKTPMLLFLARQLGMARPEGFAITDADGNPMVVQPAGGAGVPGGGGAKVVLYMPANRSRIIDAEVAAAPKPAEPGEQPKADDQQATNMDVAAPTEEK